ncbi:MAG: hypothetical protein QW279_12555 [Candidatus Jordarchaeaceae archaeon]
MATVFSDPTENIHAKHLAIGLLLASLVSIVYSIFFITEFWSLFVPVVIFNFLFVLTTFPLSGFLGLKIMLLLVGNALGVLWGLAWISFVSLATSLLGLSFEVFHAFFNPFFHSLWIVSFWSFGLSLLASSKTKREITP